MKTNDWLLLGAVAIGGYFLYTKLVKPVTEAVGSVGNAASLLTTPGINFIPGLQGVDVNKLITTPGYQLIANALPKVSLPVLPEVMTTPGYKIIGDMLNPQPKNTTQIGNTAKQIISNANAAAVRQSTPIYNTPGKQVGLATNVVYPYTAPSQQIATYNVAARVMKVDGISKKVM